jgi:benzoyl-CoA reductase/2-hydroxyglutaryl-CoA dehydratase subunit BcrC/BadD/HgdB
MAFLPRGRDAQNMMAEMNSYRKIQASGVLRKIMADHFYALDRASRAGWPKVAWCTSMGPAELLLSLGFMVYYPENHGAMLGASRTANDYIPAANAMGYSPDICSYLTSDIGAYLK